MERRPATPEEARALANPLRLRILRLCLDRSLTNEELAARPWTATPARCSTTSGCSSRPGSSSRTRSGAGRRGAIERPVPGDRQVVDARRGRRARRCPGLGRRVPRRDRGGAAGGVPWSVRLAVRLQPDAREAFEHRLQALVEELKDADDPAGRAVRPVRRPAPPSRPHGPRGVGRRADAACSLVGRSATEAVRTRSVGAPHGGEIACRSSAVDRRRTSGRRQGRHRSAHPMIPMGCARPPTP